ncbi:MAG: cupin domain-containing protein [Chloroflexi bacterium]|nr:cupin domain-containing protein [Chloroflexota bacterium]
MAGKHARLMPAPPVLRQVVYHDMDRGERELGPVFKLVDAALVPGAKLAVHVRQVVKEPPPGHQPIVVEHKHDFESVYCFLGTLKIEVSLDGEKYIVEAPRAAYIPAGVKHNYRAISGTGWVVVVIGAAKYE